METHHEGRRTPTTRRVWQRRCERNTPTGFEATYFLRLPQDELLPANEMQRTLEGAPEKCTTYSC
jgi:hypothetical protein